ncbi:MAG: signal transduction histidine kinase [Planctomycetota bacterium]|jgi:signal transduction histidine kinase
MGPDSSGRAIASGKALSIALELVGEEDLRLVQCLERVAKPLGLTRLQWIPFSESADPAARRESVEVDWELLRELQAGEVHQLDAIDRRRSPRLAAGMGHEVYVRCTAPDGGSLRLQSKQPIDWDAADLRKLVNFIDRVARDDRQAAKREEQSHAIEVGQRFSTMTHDLRNQLNLALLQLSKASLTSGGLDHIDTLKSTLSDARDMCRDTLSQPRTHSTPKPIDVRRCLIDEAAAAADVARGTHHVGVAVRCPLGLQILGERDALKRLIGNLILNAIEASSEGGEVRASANRDGPSRVVLTVTDQGRGMSSDGLHSFFGAGTSGATGTGYGTTSFLENLEILDAEARVESSLGSGTRFEVTLRSVPEADRRAVILCDRDGTRRSRWREALAERGIGAWEARDPGHALHLMRCFASPLLLLSRGSYGVGLNSLVDRIRRERVPCWLHGSRDGGPEQVLARPGMIAFLGGVES